MYGKLRDENTFHLIQHLILLKFFYFAHNQNVLMYSKLNVFPNSNVQSYFIEGPKIKVGNITFVRTKNLHHETGKKKICTDR